MQIQFSFGEAFLRVQRRVILDYCFFFCLDSQCHFIHRALLTSKQSKQKFLIAGLLENKNNENIKLMQRLKKSKKKKKVANPFPPSEDPKLQFSTVVAVWFFHILCRAYSQMKRGLLVQIWAETSLDRMVILRSSGMRWGRRWCTQEQKKLRCFCRIGSGANYITGPYSRKGQASQTQ